MSVGLALALVYGACSLWTRDDDCPYWESPCISRVAATPASVILILFSIVFGIAHARQIAVGHDGRYYHWLTPIEEDQGGGAANPAQI